MSIQRKQHFIEELKRHYGEIIAGAREAEVGTAEAADTLQRESRSREDAKGAAEFGRIASGHRARRERAKREVDAVIRFSQRGLPRYGPNSKAGLGALVDVTIEDDDGSEERTVFILPVGAGTELTGPGGDGFIQVVTPDSPVGRGLMGAACGDSFDISTGDVDREWTIVDIC
jgi:transcription elongation GreA/GreB family factor